MPSNPNSDVSIADLKLYYTKDRRQAKSLPARSGTFVCGFGVGCLRNSFSLPCSFLFYPSYTLFTPKHYPCYSPIPFYLSRFPTEANVILVCCPCSFFLIIFHVSPFPSCIIPYSFFAFYVFLFSFSFLPFRLSRF